MVEWGWQNVSENGIIEWMWVCMSFSLSFSLLFSHRQRNWNESVRKGKALNGDQGLQVSVTQNCLWTEREFNGRLAKHSMALLMTAPEAGGREARQDVLWESENPCSCELNDGKERRRGHLTQEVKRMTLEVSSHSLSPPFLCYNLCCRRHQHQ